MANIFKINDADFECEFILSNPDTKKDIELTKSAIKGLDLTEDIFNPFGTGAQIIISNPFDVIETGILLRGDGRDTFKFSLKPVDAKDDEKLEYEYVIVDEENIVDDLARSKNEKLYTLMDKDSYKLSEIIPYGTRFRGKIGKIIETILKNILGEDVIDKENFEHGDFEIDIFPEHILPPSSFKYTDLILYLLRINFMKVDDIHVKCFLQSDKKTKKYTLLPITKMFEKNSDLALEAFGLGDETNENDPSNSANPPPDTEVSVYTGQLKNIDLTSPLGRYSDAFFMNGLVHGFDPILGEHTLKEVRIKDIKKEWEKKFVDVFKTVGGKPKAFLPLNTVKTEKKFKHYSFSFPIKTNLKIVEAELINALIFYNLNLGFSVLGKTTRTSGHFIDIFKLAPHGGSMDDKLLGRWLVTSVRHMFFYDTYRNDINCIKTYVGPDAKIRDDVD